MTKWTWTAAVCVMAMFCGRALAADAAKVRVGVYDPRAVVIIYYGSKVHDTELRALMAEHEEAKAAGDQKKVAELKAKGSASQELAHQQLAGKAPIDDLLKKLHPDWEKLGKETQVDLIVPKVLYKAEGVEVVDVTEALAKQLEAGEKQMKWIRDLKPAER